MKYSIIIILLACLLAVLAGCGSNPKVHQSDVAQQADTATTFTALELMDGYQEGNPILAPLLETPEIGYPVLIVAKWGINHSFRSAENPRLCADGIRTMTSVGVLASVSNLLLMTVGPPGWVALLAGVTAGGVNAAYNDNFISECRLQERFPEYDIERAWQEGKLYGEGVRK